MKLNQEFTDRIRQWLEANPNDRNYEEGALLLLKLNGNQIMYRNIIANPRGKAEFIEYNLQKYYNFRVKELTHEQVAQMDEQVERIMKSHNSYSSTPSSSTPLQSFKQGKRSDHESLPDEIQALYVENLSIVQRMREVHLKLRSLSTADTPCPDSERYPFLKELIELDKRMHKNWETYDRFVPEGGEVLMEADVREQSKAAQRTVNLAKGRYKKNPTEELKQQIAEQYKLILNPTEKLTSELTELGIL